MSTTTTEGLKIERRAAVSLQYDPENARKHGAKNLAAIRASLERFGQRTPIVVRPNGVVVSGNGTLSQLIALGYETDRRRRLRGHRRGGARPRDRHEPHG